MFGSLTQEIKLKWYGLDKEYPPAVHGERLGPHGGGIVWCCSPLRGETLWEVPRSWWACPQRKW